MKLRKRPPSGNVIDRRGEPASRRGGFPRPAAIGGGIGLPALLIVIVVLLLNGGLGSGISGASAIRFIESNS